MDGVDWRGNLSRLRPDDIEAWRSMSKEDQFECWRSGIRPAAFAKSKRPVETAEMQTTT
jgi:hypothetical protein